MTKRFSHIFAFVVIAATALEPSAAEAAPQPNVGLAVGSSFVVEPPVARYIRELDEREMREQVRDWAVIATVARQGASPEQAAAATYELPPARLPYLEDLYVFEYGSGRRAYLNGRVLLFRDGDDRDPKATIGRLADRVKMENGEVPAKVEIYLVHDQRNEGAIRIERGADVTGADLFSSKYGYVEGPANSERELADWLGKTDELSSVQIRKGRLLLGGRRFPNSSTPNLTVDDVAALYQAHEQLDAPNKPARATLAQLPIGARAAAERVRQLLEAEAEEESLDAALLALTREFAESPNVDLKAVGEAIKATAQPTQSPAFSLDPLWLPDPADPQHPLMLRKLRAFAADPCGSFDRIIKDADALERAEPDDTRRSGHTRRVLRLRDFMADPRWKPLLTAECGTIKQLAAQLKPLIASLDKAKPEAWESELVRYYQIVDGWNQLPSGHPAQQATALATVALKPEETAARALCARYEGTAGTRVGMVMYYTDALAKLWESIDYGLSAPITEVPGFLSAPRIDLDPAFQAGVAKNPGTRVWFGPRANGVSRSSRGGDSGFLFHHVFTRVYAAGHNPVNPGHEARPREDSRRTIGWWDRHFDDVASYEPEYHRLNQIMKWSLVTAALAEGGSASYLGAVQVRRDLKFFSWQRANQAGLRFSEAFPELASPPSGRECMPLLESYSFSSMGRSKYISGGVSSAPRAAPAKVPVPDASKVLGARKPYLGSLTGDANGTAMRAHPDLGGTAVRFADAVGSPTRDVKGDVPLGTPTVTYQRGSASGSIRVQAGEKSHPIGVLEAGPGGKLHWTDGAVESKRHSAAPLPKDLASADQLAARGDVLPAAQVFKSLGNAVDGTPEGMARAAVIDAAHLRPAQVLAKIQQLQARGRTLSPEARDMLLGSLDEVSAPRARVHIEEALKRGLPLDNPDGKVRVERGRIIVTRDITTPRLRKLSRTDPTDLSTAQVYFDDRLRVGQEGYLPALGENVARWQRRRDVRIDVLDANVIGALPDQLVLTAPSAPNAPRQKLDSISPRTISSLTVPPLALLIRKCDGTQQTPTTDDDC